MQNDHGRLRLSPNGVNAVSVFGWSPVDGAFAMNHPLLSNLNTEQREAVTTVDGPILVLAGPGSGKTRTLTQRVAYLIDAHDIAPETILAVTFTNKAAGEMMNRIRELLADTTAPLPFIGTFHRFGLRLLQKHAHRMGFNASIGVYDTGDQRRLMKQILINRSINPKQHTPQSILGIISKAKNNLQTSDDLRSANTASPITAHAADCYEDYQQRLRELNAMDFDDLLFYSVALLENNDDVRHAYQQRFHYIHVDEYQDTNTAQYRLITLLNPPHNNIFVVGDDAQSIYSWRSADFRNILRFEHEYPRARTIILGQNYRSTRPILSAANCLIRHNLHQKQKTLWTDRDIGDPVTIEETETHDIEGEAVVRTIKDLQEHRGYTRNDIAILYRINAQSRALEEALLHHGIPYRLIGGTRFFERREIKDILAYLTLFCRPHDTLALARIANVPRRGIGKKTWQRIERQGLATIAERHTGAQRLRDILEEGRHRAQSEPVPHLLTWLLGATNYKQYLAQTFPDHNPSTGEREADERWENIQELFSMMEPFSAPGLLPQFLSEVALFTNIDIEHTEEDNECVSLMTLHAAKGLEFPAVIIVGCEDGLLPHSNAFESSDALEEERRLCYVGVTRAKDHLYLFHARRRLLYGRWLTNIPSRFLEELPENEVEWKRLSNVIESNPFE